MEGWSDDAVPVALDFEKPGLPRATALAGAALVYAAVYARYVRHRPELGSDD